MLKNIKDSLEILKGEDKGLEKEKHINIDLQNRINKAIKYINDYENYCMEISHNIIAILKGEDKE